MPAPKDLQGHVLDGSFRSRRHHQLLLGALLPWPELAAIQARYAAAENPFERRRIGVEFEHAARMYALVAEVQRALDGDRVNELDELMRRPPVPMSIAHDLALCHRYWRAHAAVAERDAGASLQTIARDHGVSRATIRRDLNWIGRLDASERAKPASADDDVSDLLRRSGEADAASLRIGP